MFKDKNIISLTILVVAIIIAGAIIYSAQTSRSIAGAVSAEEAKEIVMDFINNTMLQGQTPASFSAISEEYGLYKVDIIFQGNPFTSYLSKDGKTFFPEGMNIEEIKSMSQTTGQNLPTSTQTVNEPQESVVVPENISSFVSCLKDNGFVYYGANWCPYCASLTNDVFGGKEVVAPIYVECTEETELCRQKGIEGYPTILINDVRYNGARSLQGFADATGCKLN